MKVALCWGCGVGSLLALQALLREGARVRLVHVLVPGERAVPRDVVEAQAAALGLPLTLVAPASGEQEMAALARGIAEAGAARAAFGFVRGEEHVGWKVGKFVRGAGSEPLLPVRHLPPGEAARAFAEAGHRAFVRAVAPPLGPDLLARFLDAHLADALDAEHGRAGWSALRTLAVDGPLFARRLDATAGDPQALGSAWRLDVAVQGC